MKRIQVAVICALVCAATASSGKTPWFKEPGIPMTLHSPGFLLQARMPRGWTIIDNAIVPPPALGSDCRVEVRFHRDHEWNDFLVAALDIGVHRPGRRKTVLKIGGHPAVSDRYVSGDDKVIKFYLNLSNLEPDSVAVLALREGLPLDEGDCELQFLALVHSVSIVRDAPPPEE
ncbi:MAG TPA: hypothetical protein VGQ36_12980 [Thermoanaerobaculia bacterium]|jgi:hypothetical protein|nr:hypothetical protein [Thermoanaerobaculia bacterium]